MASQPPAMTPEEALQTVASVRGYREQLTARAAGNVWMVWGLVLAILAVSDLVGLHEMEAADESVEEGWSFAFPGWAPLVAMALALAGGAVATNAIWKANALEAGGRHRSWVAWVGILGLLVIVAAIGVTTVEIMGRVVDPTTAPDDTYILLSPTLAAVAAGAIALLQRKRVAAWPGLGAAAALLGAQALIPLLVSGSLQDKIFSGAFWSMTCTIAVFFAVGLWHSRKG